MQSLDNYINVCWPCLHRATDNPLQPWHWGHCELCGSKHCAVTTIDKAEELNYTKNHADAH